MHMLGSALIPSIGLTLAWTPQPAPATHYRTYSTPQQYIAKFGLVEAAQLLADEERLLTPELLGQAVQRFDGGLWTLDSTADEQRAATRALDRLTRQLATCSNYIDGYLRPVVSLPLAVGDANASTLEDCCLALTRAELADDSDNATERMDEAAKKWRGWLRDVSARKVSLVAATGADMVTETPRWRTGAIKSGYDWGKFGGVR
jgi:phage gp36-like protein